MEAAPTKPEGSTILEKSYSSLQTSSKTATPMRELLTVKLGDKWPEEVKSCVTKVEYRKG